MRPPIDYDETGTDDDELHVAFKVCNTDLEEGLTWAEVEKCEVFEQNAYEKHFLFSKIIFNRTNIACLWVFLIVPPKMNLIKLTPMEMES